MRLLFVILSIFVLTLTTAASEVYAQAAPTQMTEVAAYRRVADVLWSESASREEQVQAALYFLQNWPQGEYASAVRARCEKLGLASSVTPEAVQRVTEPLSPPEVFPVQRAAFTLPSPGRLLYVTGMTVGAVGTFTILTGSTATYVTQEPLVILIPYLGSFPALVFAPIASGSALFQGERLQAEGHPVSLSAGKISLGLSFGGVVVSVGSAIELAARESRHEIVDVPQWVLVHGMASGVLYAGGLVMAGVQMSQNRQFMKGADTSFRGSASTRGWMLAPMALRSGGGLVLAGTF